MPSAENKCLCALGRSKIFLAVPGGAERKGGLQANIDDKESFCIVHCNHFCCLQRKVSDLEDILLVAIIAILLFDLKSSIWQSVKFYLLVANVIPIISIYQWKNIRNPGKYDGVSNISFPRRYFATNVII
jgi:hypothetical protein